MKSRIILLSLFFAAMAANAQELTDALRFGRTDIIGTARFMSMGGAFSALGGDLSAVNLNPAGIGVYRSSEVAGTMSLGTSNASMSMGGFNSSNNLFRFNFNNVGYVGSFGSKENSTGLVAFNIGISYNRIKNFNRDYSGYAEKATGNGEGMRSSLSDFMAVNTELIGYPDVMYPTPGELLSDNAYNKLNWLSVVGFDGYGFEHYSISDNKIYWYEGISNHKSHDVWVRERGGIDEYGFTLGGNISNLLYFGAAFGLTDISYTMHSSAKEQFGANRDYTLVNQLQTKGTGYNGKFGVIVKPADFIRIGLSYHTPTWYNMTDYYEAQVDYYNPGVGSGNNPRGTASTPRGSSDYRMRTPHKLTAGLAFVLGKSGILSFDYEMNDFSTMTVSSRNGFELPATAEIKKYGKMSHTLKVGAEYRITPQFSVRAGGAYATLPVSNEIVDNTVKVFTAGTVPHFAVDKGTIQASIGAGYRYGSMYIDGAFVMRSQKETFYPFSYTEYSSDGLNLNVNSIRGEMKYNTYNLVLTLGVKF